MVALDVVDKNNVKVRDFQAAEGLFTKEPNPGIVHQVVVAQHAAQRYGTHKAKTRSEVSGSGQKPWRQKGTGRARAGMRTSPLWGASTIFGPVPHSHRKRVPKKLRRHALQAALQTKLVEGNFKVVTDFDLQLPKTKEAASLFERLGLGGKVLAVIQGDERNFQLAVRNLSHVKMVRPSGVDLLSLMEANAVVFSEASLIAFGECHPYE